MSQSVEEHREAAPESVGCAVITVSDTRTVETDRSGRIMIDSLENCDDFLVGPFSRVTMVTQDNTEFPAGYIGGVCDGEWRIEAIDEEQNERDEIASGDLEVDVEGDPHTYRLEIVDDEIRFFIDDEPVGEATDDRYAEPGQPGIYVAGDTLIEIESFVVEELRPE